MLSVRALCREDVTYRIYINAMLFVRARYGMERKRLPDSDLMTHDNFILILGPSSQFVGGGERGSDLFVRRLRFWDDGITSLDNNSTGTGTVRQKKVIEAAGWLTESIQWRGIQCFGSGSLLDPD